MKDIKSMYENIFLLYYKMPPKEVKEEHNVYKYLKQRETGGKHILSPDAQGQLMLEDLQRDLERRMARPTYRAPQPDPEYRVLGEFKKGGKVNKTGIYKLHKGEIVIPAKPKKNKSKK